MLLYYLWYIPTTILILCKTVNKYNNTLITNCCAVLCKTLGDQDICVRMNAHIYVYIK